jgi:hypothetical protein
MGSISKVEGLEKKREEREKRNKALQARKRGMRLLRGGRRGLAREYPSYSLASLEYSSGGSEA